jgi:hypothetical protein
VQAQAEAFQRPFDAHQKQPGGIVLMLIGMQDVGVMGVQEIGDGGDQPFLVGAGDQQNGGIAHVNLDYR